MENSPLKIFFCVLFLLLISLTENAKIHEEAHMHRSSQNGNGKRHEMEYPDNAESTTTTTTETTTSSATTAAAPSGDTRGKNPGFRTRISRGGMEYAAHVATHILEQQIENINVADQKGVKVGMKLWVSKFFWFNASVTNALRRPYGGRTMSNFTKSYGRRTVAVRFLRAPYGRRSYFYTSYDASGGFNAEL